MKGETGQGFDRPFEGQSEESEDQVGYLESWKWFHSYVQVLREEVKEYLGPEEALYGCCYLIC